MKLPFQRYSGASTGKGRMNASLHGTIVFALCSADEECMSDQEQCEEKAGLEARGICEYVCVCRLVHEATVLCACLAIKVIRFSSERKKTHCLWLNLQSLRKLFVYMVLLRSKARKKTCSVTVWYQCWMYKSYWKCIRPFSFSFLFVHYQYHNRKVKTTLSSVDLS